MEVGNLIIDVNSLYQSAHEDYHAKRYSAYEHYISEYNKLLDDSKEFGITDLPNIEFVPREQKAMYGIGSDSEISKLRETVISSERLLKRLSIFANLNDPKTNNILILDNIFSNFHKAARQLRSRYDNRSTLEVDDEYDVQDLLHVLLRLFFDDIRPEEWTPSYAGNSSRMDFLLKSEQIVIEVKKTRKGLGDREISDQLIIDKERYSTHPDCKTLVCFIYDPEFKIGNPFGLEKDLSNATPEQMKVHVFIRPRGN